MSEGCMVFVKTKKYAHLATSVTTLMHCIYSLVHGQGRQIKNLLVHLVLCTLNKLLAYNLSPYSAPLDCSILCSGSRSL